MARRHDYDPGAEPVLVIGLGRFGLSVAESLMALGHEVLAVDEDMAVVQRNAATFTNCMQADTTDRETLEQIGATDFKRVVVGIGTDLEASVLTVLALKELDVAEIWAKAINSKHAKILTSVGADHVIKPESAMGRRVAHQLTGAMIDYLEFEDRFAIARARPPRSIVGQRLDDAHVRTSFDVSILGVKHQHGEFEQAGPDTKVYETDEVIVSGQREAVEGFCGLTNEAGEDDE